MKVEFIPVAPKDRDFFRKVHHIAYRTVIESMFGWDEATQDAAADKEFSERHPQLIKYKEQIIGVVGLEDKIDHLWFGPLYILPEFQGQGIGSFVIKYFMQQADKKKVPLRLRTLRQNYGAKTLYERLGFQTRSESEIHWHLEYLPLSSIG